jgi:hypothetical protein
MRVKRVAYDRDQLHGYISQRCAILPSKEEVISMPYIDRAHRNMIDAPLDAFIDEFQGLIHSGSIKEDKIEGVLNYCITKLLKRTYVPVSYFKINRVVGLLECIKQEYYRTVAAPYEDGKRTEHGEV